MTINFIPGDVNPTETSVAHGRWKTHYVIVYGSGNNLILSTLTFNARISENLQTIYLSSDPGSIDFNSTNGYIAVSIGNTVSIYTPVNEYMRKPQWQKSLVINIDSIVNCLQWAPVENELVMGTNDSLELYKVINDLGVLKVRKIWYQSQPLPVRTVKITFNSNKIVVQSGEFDRLLKVWSRISYGEENTLFELKYLSHDQNDFIVDFKWRFRLYKTSDKVVDGSMANIKNIRNYIDTSNEDADTLFTYSYNNILRVWSTYESAGHNSIRCWGTLDLSKTFENQQIVGIFIVDNYYLQKTLFSQVGKESETGINGGKGVDTTVDSSLCTYFKNQRFDNIDLLFVISNEGQVAVYSILNVSTIPPNSIRFERVDETDLYFNPHSFSKVVTNTVFKPVIIPKVTILDPTETKLSLLFHNRVKNTIKFNALDFNSFLKPNSQYIGTTLINKFQGHDKSIRKLVKSDSSTLLSISNFASHNYLWYPLQLKSKTIITKKSQIDLTSVVKDESNVIIDALVLDKLVLTFDKLGNLVVWDCSEEDGVAKPVSIFEVIATKPKLFTLIRDRVLMVFDDDLIKCWNINGKELVKSTVGNLPDTIHKITRNEDSVSVIGIDGELKRYELDNSNQWVETFCTYTGIPNCGAIVSSRGKLAIMDESGHKLYIWDLKANILEYEETFKDKVRDIDWCSIGDNMLLSVGFKRFVLLYTELRYDYTNDQSSYSILKKVEITDYTSHDIGDSIWINDGFLVIGSGNQFFIDDRWFELGSSSDSVINNTTKQLVMGYSHDTEDDSKRQDTRRAQKDQGAYDIREIVKILNGPLPFYHPQFLIQLLYMGEVALVQLILVKLYQKLRTGEALTPEPNFSMIDEILYGGDHKIQNNDDDSDVFSTFNEHLVKLLVEKLTRVSLPSMTRHQQITLTSTIAIVQSIDKYKTLLDENGIRFLIGFKLFQLSSKQTSLTMRDINFALHSTQKDLLISIIEEAYSYKFTLDIVKSLGLVYWVHNFKLQEIIENLVKNEFNETRDPSGLISLLYIALNKKQVLVGLWRTVSHKEKDKILKFISNDFKDKKWKKAAMANAFALLGKHRYLDTAYFFLLADSVTDCCNMINSKLEDFQLSLIISKLYNFVRNTESDNRNMIERYLVKDVIEKGDKWMNSWLFWELKEKHLSIEALVRPPIDIIKQHLNYPKDYKIKFEASKFYDPALILLFDSIKSKTVEYQKGSSSISLKEETDFLLNICLIYTKMGCDYLALILLRNWKFDSPVPKKKEESVTINNGFNEFKAQPQQQVFEEPDMSAFDFGF